MTKRRYETPFPANAEMAKLIWKNAPPKVKLQAVGIAILVVALVLAAVGFIIGIL